MVVVVVGVVVVGVVGDTMDDGGGAPTGLVSPGLDMDNDDGERVSEWGPSGTTRLGYGGGCAGGRVRGRVRGYAARTDQVRGRGTWGAGRVVGGW